MKKTTRIGMTALGITAALAGGTVAGVYLEKEVLQRNGLDMPSQSQDAEQQKKLEQELREKIEKEMNAQFEKEKQDLENQHQTDLEAAKQEGKTEAEADVKTLKDVISTVFNSDTAGEFTLENGDLIKYAPKEDKSGIYVLNTKTLEYKTANIDTSWSFNVLKADIYNKRQNNFTTYDENTIYFQVSTEGLFAIKDNLDIVKMIDLHNQAFNATSLQKYGDKYFLFGGSNETTSLFEIDGLTCKKITTPEELSGHLSQMWTDMKYFSIDADDLILYTNSSQTSCGGIYRIKDGNLEILYGDAELDAQNSHAIYTLNVQENSKGDKIVLANYENNSKKHIWTCNLSQGKDSIQDHELAESVSSGIASLAFLDDDFTNIVVGGNGWGDIKVYKFQDQNYVMQSEISFSGYYRFIKQFGQDIVIGTQAGENYYLYVVREDQEQVSSQQLLSGHNIETAEWYNGYMPDDSDFIVTDSQGSKEYYKYNQDLHTVEKIN